MAKKKSKIGLGLLLGATAGAVAGLFLAPKTGKELRKDAKILSDKAKKFADEYKKKLEKEEPSEAAKIVFGDVTDTSVAFMQKANKELSEELGILKEKYSTIDKNKYSEAVKNLIDNYKADKALPEGSLKKLAAYLEKDAKVLVSRPKTTKKAPAKKKAAPKKKVAAKKTPTKKA